MAPKYDPLYLFRLVNTAVEIECFFCTEQIDPLVDFTHFIVTIPKKTLFTTHVSCFEQLQWSMLNFYIKYVRQGEQQVVQ